MAQASKARASLTGEFVVADFAAGSGELLLAAAALWPDATMVATDIDCRAIRKLRSVSNSWRTGICDFTNARSRQSSPVLRKLSGRTNLVLLNPPFSCRGGKKVAATAEGNTSECSLGLAFVVNSIDYLTETGELIAVLPQGSLTSERDAETWNLLRGLGDTEVLKNNGFGTFAQAAVRTAVVRFQKRQNPRKAEPLPTVDSYTSPSRTILPTVHIVRGTTQMNEIQPDDGSEKSIAFIHSTNLQDFTVASHQKVRSNHGRYAVGPMVLLPRVGQPRPSKVAKYPHPDGFMLSDCVIALICQRPEITDRLWKDLQSNWKLLEQEYVGSGAPYITRRRISDLLTRLGYSPVVCSSNDSKNEGSQNGKRQNQPPQ